MQIIQQAILLFALNLFDALWTLLWVRAGIAEEGNQLMARLLNIGDFPFLAVKIVIGALAAAVIIKWGDLRLARYGAAAALVVYFAIMGVHIFTGLAAFGFIRV